jgi:hypothetical protein
VNSRRRSRCISSVVKKAMFCRKLRFGMAVMSRLFVRRSRRVLPFRRRRDSGMPEMVDVRSLVAQDIVVEISWRGMSAWSFQPWRSMRA